MLHSNPLVSVVIPAYNAERFVAATLESVIAQTYRHLEVLVVDDGSLDATAEIVERFQQRDSRVTYIRQANAGVAAARNAAIASACGDFIAPIDADDIWFPENIATQLALMVDPSVGMTYAWSAFIDEGGHLLAGGISNLWQGSDYLPLAYRNFPGNASCVLIRRSCLDRVGGYDSSYRDLNAQGCEDWDLYLRLAECHEVRVVPRLLVGYRQVAGSMSSNPEPMRRGADLVLERFAQRHADIDPSIYRWSRCDFAWYVAIQCSRAGNHRKAFSYIKMALSFDYSPLLMAGFHKLYFRSAIGLLFQPFVRLLWPDRQAYLVSTKEIAAAVRTLNPFHRALSLVSLQQRQERTRLGFWHRMYDRFFAWRLERIRPHAQATVPSPDPNG